MSYSNMTAVCDYLIDCAAKILNYPDFQFIILCGLAVYILDSVFRWIFHNRERKGDLL